MHKFPKHDTQYVLGKVEEANAGACLFWFHPIRAPHPDPNLNCNPHQNSPSHSF